MNAKVGFNEVQNYAQMHNIDFKTAAQKLGLSTKEAEVLENLGGELGAPVDGFQKKPFKSVTLKSGRKVNVYKGADGKNIYEYVAADGTKLKEDYFLQKEGLTGRHFAINSKGNLVTVKNSDQNKKQESANIVTKVFNKVKKDVEGYVNNFTQAWNKSSGVVETTGALVGATTKTVTEMTINAAHNIEKGVEEITGSQVAGKVASHVAGVGLAADAAKAVEKFGDWSSDKIRNVAKNYTGTERKLLEEFANFVDGMNAADIALMFAGGVGAAKYLKQLPQILKLLTAGGATIATMASCSNDDAVTVIDNSETKVSVAANITMKIDNKALADAYNKGIQDLMTFLKPYMDQLVNNQNTMMDFVAQILAKLDSQGVKLDNIEELIKNFMAQYGIDSKNKDELLAKIYTAITNADAATREALNGILEKIDQNNAKADETNALLTKLIALVNKLGQDGKELGAIILKMLNKIGLSMNANFSKLLEAVERGNVSLDEIKAMLAELNKLVADGNKQNQELGEKILNYLGSIGFEMNRNFTAVLEAINKGVAGTESLRDLLEKILDNQDKNTKAIIDAIGNIKIDGGNIDLSSIEKMLAELLKQSQKNGNILSNIDAKTDVIATTTKSILAALEKEFGKNDERYKNVMNILTVIANKEGSKGNDEKLLAKLDKILAKLDEILDAIKNHKVEVDVTGKVTCECNCGNNGKHEGILGDLNKILD